MNPRLQNALGLFILLASIFGFVFVISWGGWIFIACVMAWWLLRRVRDFAYFLIGNAALRTAAERVWDQAAAQQRGDWGPPKGEAH